ncbi:MAG: transposase [Nitrososphaerota archaeon]|nr:transposase [Nitrososphaerota archaeon]
MLRKCAGNARFAYNWGLRWKMNVIEHNLLPHPSIRMPSSLELQAELDALSKEKIPWVYDPSRDPPFQALKNLDRAFGNYLYRRRRFPSFKRRGGRASFRLYGGVTATWRAVSLPDIGSVELKERHYIPSGQAYTSATVSGRAGRWYVSVSAPTEAREPSPVEGPLVGVDRGVGRMATVSDGTAFENPRALARNERKLKRLQRAVSRKQKGSKNRDRAVLALERKHLHIDNARLDAIHKATTSLAKTKSTIVIDYVGVSELVKERSMAKKVEDAAMTEFARQLGYKTKLYGSKLTVAPWWYPSTKRCSGCGNVKEKVALGMRVYRCYVCGLTIDRDLNAARNLEQWPGLARKRKDASG